jgi:hypothetical protein
MTEINEESRSARNKLARKGALIIGGIVVALMAIDVIVDISRINGRLNYMDDRHEEYTEALNQLLADVRELKGEPSYR